MKYEEPSMQIRILKKRSIVCESVHVKDEGDNDNSGWEEDGGWE